MRRSDQDARSAIQGATREAQSAWPADEWAGHRISDFQRAYSEGTLLFPPGARLRDVLAIERGFIKLMGVREDGREMILSICGPGRMLGLSAAILEVPMPVAAVTLTRCQVRWIPIQVLRRRIERLDEFSRALLMHVSREAYEHVVRQAAMGLLSARERVEQVLGECLSLSGIAEMKSAIPLPVPLRQRELAEWVAITPEHLSRILREMERDGLIRRHKGRVIIVAPDRLRRGLDF